MMEDPICTACSGKKSEHFDGEGKPITRHMFTEREGELQTREAAEKNQQQQLSGPSVIRLPGAQTNEAGAIGRLCEVLLENNMMSTAQALYVAGMGSKPEASSGFADPAAHPFYKPSPGAGY